MGGEEAQPSLLTWLITSLGFWYTILLPLAGLLSFALAVVIVLRGRGPLAAASLILTVHVPLLVGLFAAIHGGIETCTVIATSAAAPRPSDLAEGISTALVAPLVGMLLMIPGYVTAAVGGFIRSLLASDAAPATFS